MRAIVQPFGVDYSLSYEVPTHLLDTFTQLEAAYRDNAKASQLYSEARPYAPSELADNAASTYQILLSVMRDTFLHAQQQILEPLGFTNTQISYWVLPLSCHDGEGAIYPLEQLADELLPIHHTRTAASISEAIAQLPPAWKLGQDYSITLNAITKSPCN